VVAINNGSLIVTGDLGNVPQCLANVHDAMARLTDAQIPEDRSPAV
jgi:ethanolamine utilization microcompartment shell protein EutS